MIKAARLPNRGVLKITGNDRAAFLQGLITNDVHKISMEQGIYAALLSPQGKFQYDLFIVACQDLQRGNSWLMECDQDRADMLLKRLSLYKLRSDVTIENISDHMDVIAAFGQGTLTQLNLPPRLGAIKQIEDGILMVDPRLMDLGVRILLPINTTDSYLGTLGIELISFEDYDLHRLKLGVPDGVRDVLVDRGIMLECGFEELHAIDWTKGCYMGQELTARTRYRGLIRKRLIPVRIQGGSPPYQCPIFQDAVEVGEMRSAREDWGIAMIRLEALHKPLPFSSDNATVTPHIPQWMCLPSLTDNA